jgi:hypothetical protein
LNKNAIRLLLWTAVAYVILLVLIRGSIPDNSIPTITLTGIPLIVITAIIVQDLLRRSTRPTKTLKTSQRERLVGRPVQLLSGQIRVAESASDSYFEGVIRARLKELMTTKASLETGLEYEQVRQILADSATGPRLIGDTRLYGLLYAPAPGKGSARLKLIEEAVALIGAWKT